MFTHTHTHVSCSLHYVVLCLSCKHKLHDFFPLRCPNILVPFTILYTQRERERTPQTHEPKTHSQTQYKSNIKYTSQYTILHIIIRKKVTLFSCSLFLLAFFYLFLKYVHLAGARARALVVVYFFFIFFFGCAVCSFKFGAQAQVCIVNLLYLCAVLFGLILTLYVYDGRVCACVCVCCVRECARAFCVHFNATY